MDLLFYYRREGEINREINKKPVMCHGGGFTVIASFCCRTVFGYEVVGLAVHGVQEQGAREWI